MWFMPHLCLVLLVLTPTVQDLPQRVGAIAPEEAALLAEGWTALAARDFAKASQRAATALARFPRSVAALQLSVEIDIEQSGSSGGLDTYERWLAGRRLDEPMLLRRIAAALLQETAITARDSGSRAWALVALANDGDASARSALDAAIREGSRAETELLVRKGNDQAVDRAVEELKRPIANKMALIEALGEVGNARSVTGLMLMLQDPRPEHRAAAAEALGKLGAKQAIPVIRQMLKETNGPPLVPMAAAGALLRLGDDSGLAQLQQWLTSPIPGMRVGAAKALAPRADPTWTSTVRTLGADEDPTIRVEAAKLLSTVEPLAAQGILDRLLTDKDQAVRELAGSVAVSLPDDLARLRTLLRIGPITRLRAADRLLELTR
jgi:HEAT repeat protein